MEIRLSNRKNPKTTRTTTTATSGLRRASRDRPARPTATTHRGGRRRRPRENGDANRAPPRSDDERADQALAFVQRFSSRRCRWTAGCASSTNEEDDEEIGLEIDGRDAGRIIGKKGQVLAAIQFITNRVINRPGTEKRHILVDAEGYRRRRESSLASMARRLGKQAVSDGKIITFEPMNPRDRRVVHMALAKFEGVVTKSEGEGDERRVQMIPVRRRTEGTA